MPNLHETFSVNMQIIQIIQIISNMLEIRNIVARKHF